MVWGKLLGGLFGFLIGGPLGAVLGAALGHPFDKGLRARLAHDESLDNLAPGDADRVRMAFFTATFSVLGHVAKADGHVAPSEIKLAEAVMSRMSLTPELRQAAIKLFNEGKQPQFELDPLLLQFRQECQRRTNLFRLFLEIQIQAAYADGEMAAAEQAVLLHVSRTLGFPDFVFRQLDTLVRVSLGLHGGFGSGGSGTGGWGSGAGASGQRRAPSDQMRLADAYGLLGLSDDAGKADVKRAYRRMMSQHHPDKLASRGLPDEMIRMATDKTQNIQKAYERIKDSRGW